MGVQKSDTLLDLLAECQGADTGTLYESRGTLGISYRTRTSLYNQPVVLDLDYEGGEIAPPFQPVDDDQRTRNDITVKRQDGSDARAVLETGRMSVLSPTKGGVGRYDSSVTVNVESDGQLPDIARWLVHLGTVDETRYPTIRVNLANPTVAAAAIENAVLDVDVNDRVTVSNPKAGQTPDQITQLVQGYTETLNRFEHSVAFNCSPESPYQVLTLDGGSECRLDSDDSTLAAAVTSSATSLSVAVVGSTLWTTSVSEMPFEIKVGGEVMSVTAISGATSPQTFTVTRSVNGVVKAHSVGAEVHLARPSILAL